MKQEKLYNETEIRRFLLGEMPEEDCAALEEEFLADEHLFEKIRVVEDELIEDYVRGTLIEKDKFERNFLTTKKRRERVAFTRAMITKLSEKSKYVEAKTPFFASLIEFFRQPKFAFGAAFTILAVIFGFGFFAFRQPGNEIEIAKQTTPTPNMQTVTNQAVIVNQPTNQNIALNSNVNEKRETNKTNLNTNNQSEKRDANVTTVPKKEEIERREVAVNPVLALFVGTVRSEGKTGEILLKKNVSGVNLVLNLESSDYKSYRAEVVDQNGNVVFRSENLLARSLKIYTVVPAKTLERGDYLVKLYGKNSNGNEESVADYQFRVNQK